MFRLRSFLSFLLLLTLLAAMGCTPRRGGNGGGGGSDDDDSASDDDDSVGDDDDSVGDDDDATDPPTGDVYSGPATGYLKASEGGGSCNGNVTLTIDGNGTVTSGVITCGSTCEIYFAGPYAFSEELFYPSFSCSIGGVTPEFDETEGYIWGSQNSNVSGSVNGYGKSDYFSLSFDAYYGE